MEVKPEQFLYNSVYIPNTGFTTCKCVMKRVCCQKCDFHCGVNDSWPGAKVIRLYMKELL